MAEPQLNEYEIIFRPLCHDHLTSQACPAYQYWHVEAYDDEWPWPVGMAFVRDSTVAVTLLGDKPNMLTVELQYIFVLGGRRRGIGTALYRAIKDRWPGAYCSGATEEGTAFLKAMGREDVGSPTG